MPCNGDVGFTCWLHEAGRFDAYEEAIDTAALRCHEGYFVTPVRDMPEFSSSSPSQRFWDGH